MTDDDIARRFGVIDHALDTLHDRLTISVQLLCGDENVAGWTASAIPDVGEVVTVTRREWGPKGEVESNAYRVHRREWVHTVTLPPPGAKRLPTHTLEVILDSHVALDPPPTFECGECGRRFQTEDEIRAHTAGNGHDGTAWLVVTP